MNLINDVIKPTDQQREFMRTVLKNVYTLYGGAAGGGKSYILRWTLIYLLTRWYKETRIKGIRVGLFCEDYPALRDRHLAKIQYELPEWIGKYKDSSHELTLSPALGGGVISFRNLDDPSKYLSSEFAAIAIDELTLNDQTVFDFLRMRLRWPGINDTKFMAATNPGGKGHGWVKNLWVDRNFPKELQPYADKIAFVRAKATDNPHLPQSYIDNLGTLPEALRKAYLEGSWDIFAGQVFTEWSRDKHVIKPFEIPKSWPRFRSMDWGYSKPYAIYWYTVNFDGVIYIYRELYGFAGIDIGTKETAREVARRVKKLEEGEEVIGYADPACWSKTGHDGPTIAEEFSNEGVHFTKADNDRIQGKMQVHARLKDNSLKLFENCQHLIRTLPMLVYDEHRPEDVDTTQEDHAYDSLRYGLMSRPWKPAPEAKHKEPDYKEVGEREERSWMVV